MAWVETKVLVSDKLPQRYNIYIGADFQLGSDSTDKVIIRNWVKRVSSDPNGLWMILGDIEDDDRPTSRIIRKSAFSGRKEVLTADAKKHRSWIHKEILPILEPLTKTRLGSLGVLAGHHWYDLGDMTSTEYICNVLGTMGKKHKVPYLGQMSAWIRLKFRRPGKVYGGVDKLLHVQHGVGGGGTLASALNKLVKTSHGFYADCYVRAHDCTLVGAKYDILRPKESDTPELVHKTVTLLNVGSATRGYEVNKSDPSYVEMGMMNPQTLGWGELHAQHYIQSRAIDKSCNLAVDFKLEI